MPLNAKASMEVLVEDNQYNHTVVQLTGETYEDIITLDPVRRMPREEEELEEGRRGGGGGGGAGGG